MKALVSVLLGLLLALPPAAAQHAVVPPGLSGPSAGPVAGARENVETLGFVRIAVEDVAATSRWLREEMGFTPWEIGARASGEESVMVMLSSGQSVEFFSRRPFYERLEMTGARTVALALYVRDIGAAMMALAASGVPTTDIIPLHAGGETSYPKMFDLLFIRSFDFPLWNFSFAQRDNAGIAAVRAGYPEYDDRKWQEHGNGADGLSEVWFGVRDLAASERHLAELALVASEEQGNEKGERVYTLSGMVLRLVSPDHPERGAEIARRIEAGGEGAFHIVFRSDAGRVSPGAQAIPGSELLLEVR